MSQEFGYQADLQTYAYADKGVITKASEIGLLANALDMNNTVLLELFDRLGPVLGPEYSDPSEKVPTPVVSRLAELRMNLERQTSALRGILERLEI